MDRHFDIGRADAGDGRIGGDAESCLKAGAGIGEVSRLAIREVPKKGERHAIVAGAPFYRRYERYNPRPDDRPPISVLQV